MDLNKLQQLERDVFARRHCKRAFEDKFTELTGCRPN